MLRKPKKQTVAEKVSKLLAHPNDSESDDDSDIDENTGPRLVDFEPEEYDLPDGRSTEFRKRNVKLLSEQSERYKGKISSRKELEDEEEDEHGEEEELSYEESDSDEDEALKAFKQKSKTNVRDDKSEEGSEEEEQEGEDDGTDDEDDDDDDGSEEDDDDEVTEEEAEENLMTKTNHQAEIQKGLCVQNQLRIWERLLELRINTHKFTSKANQLPPPETLTTLSSNNEELQTVLAEAQERSTKLLQQLLALQSALTQQNSEHRQAVKRKSPTDQSEPSLKRLSLTLQDNFQQTINYRNEVLLKWDDRTKLLTPGAGLKRKSGQEDYDIIKKINSALASRSTLVEKSQILKTLQPAEKQEELRQPHIYDDSDFYHQQLRELIEYKASSTSNMSDITKQFVELQKLRQKMKKKVDTRASKGRKLRYVVHNKLINFMAPNEASDWTESSKTELYKSLFV